MNKLLSSKFQVPGTGPLVGERETYTLTNSESCHELIEVDAQEPKAFFHTFGGHQPTPLEVGRKKHNRIPIWTWSPLCLPSGEFSQ
jgi:hypothetical protein